MVTKIRFWFLIIGHVTGCRSRDGKTGFMTGKRSPWPVWGGFLVFVTGGSVMVTGPKPKIGFRDRGVGHGDRSVGHGDRPAGHENQKSSKTGHGDRKPLQTGHGDRFPVIISKNPTYLPSRTDRPASFPRFFFFFKFIFSTNFKHKDKGVNAKI